MKKVLIISAHPDDMEIGMGGTAAKLVESGHSVISVILTDGRRSPNPFGIPEEKMAKIRHSESKRAAEILGINETIFFNFQSITNKDQNTATIQLVEVINSVAPQTIFTLHPTLDRHPTHKLSGNITLDALNQSQLASHMELWSYEVWGLFNTFDRFEDISDQIGKKMKAIQEHHSQVAAIPYAEGIAGLNRWRAIFADPQQSKVQAAFAEVFLRLK
ncbi:MAG TPA: PIG-L deacetylase family protein [Acidobacteriota bacterium]|nr:PIG-L deacetylase family protein [Acidobacteriota bacterium]